MLYQFDENNNGAVIAEDKLENLESYYGLRYPESDIPAPARRLLTSNWIRIIPDAQAEAIDLVPLLNPVTGKPLDLTFSTLRSPSPCHLEYLYNMGVGSSLTISLIKDNKLWGLIACHHQTTKFISYELRKACEFLGRVFFAEISSREETEDYDYRMKLNSVHSLLVDSMTQEENFVDGLVKHDPNLLELTNAQGAAICFGGNYTLIGKTPLEEDLDKLIEWLRENVDQDIFYTESLADLYPEAIKYKDIASGLLVIPISKRNYVIWFRQEVIQSVSWGGNPYQSPATELSL
jgi:chemotaxis family two-component system sensor kinase Cph1